MLGNKTLTLKRLQKEERDLINNPIPNLFVRRDGHLNFYFIIYNLEDEYKDGFYYGLLEMHENYPFGAPKLFFYTPSGRFEIDTPICTSFTNYHPESWTSAWNIRSLLLATVSFMTSNEGAYGCRSDSTEVKIRYAKKSLQYNLAIPKFRELFKQDLKKHNIIKLQNNPNQPKQQLLSINPHVQSGQPIPNLANEQQMLLPNIPRHHNNRRKKLIIIVSLVGVITLAGCAYIVLH